MSIKRFGAGLAGSLVMAFSIPAAALAAGIVVVTPANTQGFAINDTRPGGSVTYVNDTTAPYGKSALQLTTDATTTAKAQYLKNTATPLTQVGTLSYYTKQVSAAFSGGLPAYQLPICLFGVTATGCATNPALPAQSGFTTLTYEPYVSEGNTAVANNVWQKWNVSAGKFYSSRAVGSLQPSQGTFTYTLAQIKQEFPNAMVIQFGVNIGSNNPSYVVRTDGLEFAGTVYNFELTNPPTSPAQCLSGGFVNFTNANGVAFTSQMQCVLYAATHGPGVHIINSNNVNITNSNSQTSVSGSVNVSGNTSGGSATSGNASTTTSSSTSVVITSQF